MFYLVANTRTRTQSSSIFGEKKWKIAISSLKTFLREQN